MTTIGIILDAGSNPTSTIQRRQNVNIYTSDWLFKMKTKEQKPNFDFQDGIEMHFGISKKNTILKLKKLKELYLKKDTI